MAQTAFDCGICYQLSTKPYKCNDCGQSYCQDCLMKVFKPFPFECLKCGSQCFETLSQLSLQVCYDQILKQQSTSQTQQEQGQIGNDQNIQQLEKENKCLNYELCMHQVCTFFEYQRVCSIECLIYLSVEQLIINQNFYNFRDLIEEQVEKIEQILLNKTQQIQLIKMIGITNFEFDDASPHVNIVNRRVILQEEEYVFKTAISNTQFTNGIHYWEILPLEMTQKEMKIGISTHNQLNFNIHFFGFTYYYTIGHFRGGSNAKGHEYGIKFKNSGCVGVILDMDRGILGYSYNGIYLGHALISSELQHGPFHPAVAMMHRAGFDYRVGIPIPQEVLYEFQK